MCTEFLAEHLAPENVMSVAEAAEKQSCPELEAEALQYAARNLDDVSTTESWLSMPLEVAQSLAHEGHKLWKFVRRTEGASLTRALGRWGSQDEKREQDFVALFAEQRSSAWAANVLGHCYDNGYGVPQDSAKAVEWWTTSAELGSAQALSNLGMCYGSGKGVLQDWAKAARWYTKGAEQGNASMQYNLGVCYKSGKGVPQDMSKAAE